jgi:succinoglycan biosynthesis transport protein ExoP
MSKPDQLPVLPQQGTNSTITPIVPLNFVYPGLTPSQIFSIIWGYRKASLIIMFVVMALVVVTLKILPRTYEAEAALMVNYEVNDPVNGKELPAAQLGSYIVTQMELVRNPELISAVVNQLQLTSNQEFAAGYNGKVGTLQQWVVQQVGQKLTVYQGQGGSQLIYVRFSAKNPDLAAQVANAIAEKYKKQEDERAVNQPIERTALYSQRLDELKKNVELAQQDVTEFYKKNKLVDQGNKANIDLNMLTTLEQRLLEARNERREAESLASGDQSASDSVLASQEVQGLKAELAKQQLQLANMERLYTADYPKLPDLRSSIEETKQSLANAVQKYAANKAQKLAVAKQLEKSLKIAVAKQRAKVLANSKLHDQAKKYVLALESAQAVYKRALDGYDEFVYSTRRHYSNVSFVNRATPPLKASKPKIIKGLIMGVVTAFMLGIGVPFGYELFNRRVRCRDDLERDYGIPVLGELRSLPRFGARIWHWQYWAQYLRGVTA